MEKGNIKAAAQKNTSKRAHLPMWPSPDFNDLFKGMDAFENRTVASNVLACRDALSEGPQLIDVVRPVDIAFAAAVSQTDVKSEVWALSGLVQLIATPALWQRVVRNLNRPNNAKQRMACVAMCAAVALWVESRCDAPETFKMPVEDIDWADVVASLGMDFDDVAIKRKFLGSLRFDCVVDDLDENLGQGASLEIAKRMVKDLKERSAPRKIMDLRPDTVVFGTA